MATAYQSARDEGEPPSPPTGRHKAKVASRPGFDYRVSSSCRAAGEKNLRVRVL